MKSRYQYCDEIGLFIEGQIPKTDATRQERTAKEILKRLRTQPGVILADEVGMGKTFVALAVAASVAISDKNRRPVVVMVPPSLKEKWPRDFMKFRENCLSPRLAKKIQYGRADRAVQFLKFLDDPIHKRKSILFVTHGAMSRGLTDKWVKLALISQSVNRRNDADKVRYELSKVLGSLLYMNWVERDGTDIWIKLMKADPSDWLWILQRKGIDPEGDDDPKTDDDPVPEAIAKILPTLNTDDVFNSLRNIPKRRSKYFEQHLKYARQTINEQLREIWKQCLSELDIHLPLLVLDEAHHLKNPGTRLATLFRNPDAHADAEEISQKALSGVFERMVFLTATPFQLGHAELCSVLDRFKGVAWNRRVAPEYGLEGYKRKIENLREALDAAQTAAVSLDTAWGSLSRDDLIIGSERIDDIEQWWEACANGDELSPQVQRVLSFFEDTNQRMREAERLLKPWVIRHLRSRYIPDVSAKERRIRKIGNAINDDYMKKGRGILVEGNALLPFLLAARATSTAPDSRPVYAEGLASSYEAFLHTRRQNLGIAESSQDRAMDNDDDESEELNVTDAMRWYLDNLEALVPKGDARASLSHPKIAATVQRVVDIWENREKCLVFCHFVATGKTLRNRIAEAIEKRLWQMASKELNCPIRKAPGEIERLGKRFFDEDSPIRLACDEATRELLSGFPRLIKHEEELVEIVRRYARTPTFLVRYFPLSSGKLRPEDMIYALKKPDQSGMTLKRLLADFFVFLEERCSEDERSQYIEEVNRVQTGKIRGKDISSSFDPEEILDVSSNKLLPNVRLVNGSTKSETRQRLMLTFNTPFYPEVMVASSVMAEGVDLHLNCRFVIHHDLCWNPSTLEQRTGRIDRIGAKVEQCGESIHVYLPYIAETQDEKMFRVVMDRERWFSVVMGENYRVDAWTTDKLAERVPFPLSAAAALAFRLEVFKSG